MEGLNRLLTNAPQLELLKQTSVTEEKVKQNGQPKLVHIVVKNSPFEVLICLRNAPNFNFNHLAFNIKLVYDVSDEKEVSFVNRKPLEYKSVVTEMDDQLSFEVKLKVLSSQHENNFFRLKIFVWDPLNPQFPQLEVLSGPIRVTAKPLRRGNKLSVVNMPQFSLQEPSSSEECRILPETSRLPHKRSYNEAFMIDKLEAIESRQVEQISLLKRIAAGQEETKVETSVLREEIGIPDLKRRKVDTEESIIICSYLRTYSSMSLEEKAEWIRNMLSIPSSDLEVLVEMIDLFNTVGLQREASKVMYNNTEGNLIPQSGFSDSCHLEQLYNEIFY